MIIREMREVILCPGQLLWYKHKHNGEVWSIAVESVFPDSFTFTYNGKLHRLSLTVIGSRLFRYPDDAFGINVPFKCARCVNAGTQYCQPYGEPCDAYREVDRRNRYDGEATPLMDGSIIKLYGR